jgi:hypothetical protein
MDGQGCSLFYPLWSKKDAPITLSKMVHDMQGVPEIIVSDGSGEQTGGQWKKEVNLSCMKSHLMEPYSRWQNHLEQEIGIIKTAIKRKMSRARSHDVYGTFADSWLQCISARLCTNALLLMD